MDTKLDADLERTAESSGNCTVYRSTRRHRSWPLLVVGIAAILALSSHVRIGYGGPSRIARVVQDEVEAIKARCENLKLTPGPPPDFGSRTSSDRFVPGTKATLIRNGTIWTGNGAGKEVLKGDILIDQGLIKLLGDDVNINSKVLNRLSVDIINAEGGWITPGIVDLHTHLGVNPVPMLSGTSDTNSRDGIVQPWLRSIDALNTHDDSYKLLVAGGMTTALVLPGSANDIGGQAFVIKLRPTKERSATSMVLEPPFTLNSTDQIDLSLTPRWRHMKHACGENPRRVYSNSRMDNIWSFREIYDTARQIKESQDAFCARVLQDDEEDLGAFPEELQYEALVDVLRGRVKVQVHCYEAVDLDDIVRLTNEFKFPIAAFHHAAETYLVPDLLKKAYGHVPASAMFATNARFKRESFRASEFAPRILADNGLPVVMKRSYVEASTYFELRHKEFAEKRPTDAVLNGRYLLYEAQQAHYYGLPDNLALASVTSVPAEMMGMDHRVGFIRTGYDADLVLWDSHPLTLGATPRQVFVDGIPQFDSSYAPPVLKPEAFQSVPETPNFDKEAEDAVKYEGLPPIEPQSAAAGTVVFKNVGSLTTRDVGGSVKEVFAPDSGRERGIVIAQAGKVVCAGKSDSCSLFPNESDTIVVDLKGGSISPGLLSFGSSLGLEEINLEASTRDGVVLDPLDANLPSILGDGTVIRAVDGLQFATRHAYLAYRAGVTVGVSPPLSNGFLSGLSVAFGLGSAHKLEEGALVQNEAAVHVSIGHSVSSGSVSTQVAALRHLLLDPPLGDSEKWFKEVANGQRTLVVYAESVDIIATLLQLKKEVEASTGKIIQLTVAGGSEAHLLATELAEAGVGIIAIPSRPFPETWERRRILQGPPITRDSAISVLLAHNVTVGIGVEEPWSARSTRFDVAWAALEARGEISKPQALALASTNLEKLLGLNIDPEMSDLVATERSDLFDFESKVVGIIAPRKGVVDLI